MALALPALAATPATSPARQANSADVFRYMPKVKADGDNALRTGSLDKLNGGKVKFSASSANAIEAGHLPTADDVNYIYDPDGSIWHYTLNLEKEVIDHGTYKETKINGYEFTIYNPSFEVVGTIHDTIELTGSETGVADVSIGPQLTRKFFNTDDKYEAMICIATTTSEYVNITKTLVYSLGVDEPLMTIPGYYVSAINTATDAWSEKFWVTFVTEEETQTPEINGVMNMADNVFTVYKAAGYNGMEDPVMSFRVPTILVSGENAMPFMATVYDGMPYFSTSMMKYCYYEDPYDYENENLTPDNELQIKLYTLPNKWSSELELYSTTTIPSDATSSNINFLYLGAFSYDDDIALGHYTDDGTPAFIITKEIYNVSNDGYIYNYDVMKAAPQGETAAAEQLVSLAKGVDGGYFLSDLPGYDPQVMFIINEGDAYRFNFVNLYTGQVESTLPQVIDDEISMSASIDRVAGGDSYLYAVSQTTGTDDAEGNTYHRIAYITPEGDIDHVDRINLGQDIAYAQVYMGEGAFNPYNFNLDDATEYMVLAKRYDQKGSSASHDELLVVSTDPEVGTLLSLRESEEFGALRYIYFSNLGTDDARLVVIYCDDSWRYTAVDYKLPFTYFTKGEGTIDNPYEITTVGELAQIKAFPAAHFALGADIDAQGKTLTTGEYTFTGTFDGRGHTISNLSMNGGALFPTLMGSEASVKADEPTTGVVRDVNFVDPVFTPSADAQGIVAGSLMYGRIINVHVYGATVNATGKVGGLAGGEYLYSVIEGSSVNANITASEGAVGGIVAKQGTAASVVACAFTGSINGETEVGGIVGTSEEAACKVTDCHVNAAIKGQNTIGGIVGSSVRGQVARCHVQGALEATEAAMWGGGVKMGGVVGSLQPDYSSSGEVRKAEGEDPVTTQAVISGCYVNLTSMTAPADAAEGGNYEGENDTMHRIVGYSRGNVAEETGEYDDEWNPIYGDLLAAEDAIANNYAVSTLARGNEAIADDAASTEGASVNADELDRSFFENLGYEYGFDVTTPWSNTGMANCPTLYHEGGLAIFDKSAAEVNVDEEVTVYLSLKGGVIDEDALGSFSCNVSDESVLEMTGSEMAGEAIALTFKGLKEGEATVTASINGKEAKCVITVKPLGAVDNIASDAVRIGFDGRTATAQGCLISVYNLAGMNVLSGIGSCDMGNLAAGIYIVNATDANGMRHTLKVRVR